MNRLQNYRGWAAGLFLIAASFAPATAAPQGDAPGPLKVANTFKIGSGARWDYITVDGAAKRIYLSQSDHALVLDADKGTTIGVVTDTPGIHGIAIAPEANLGFTSNGSEGMVSVFDTKTLKTTKKVKAGQNPDAIMYEPFSKKIFVMNGGGNVTVIDPAALDKDPVTLTIEGKLEAGASDGAGHFYVNVEDKSEIVTIDTKTMKVTAHWPLAPGEEPSGLAIDPVKHRLYSGCGGSNTMVVVDSQSGKILASLPIGAGVDGCAFDSQLGLALSSNGGDGSITAVKEGPAGTYVVAQTLKTQAGARTLTYDAVSHKTYLPCQLPSTTPTAAPSAGAARGARGQRGRGGRGVTSLAVLVVGPAAAM